MDTHILETYGAPRTIRYLVTSIDDLREAAETVRFILQQGCNHDDLGAIMKSVLVSALPLPKSLSSFIIGFDVPSKSLEAVSASKSIIPSRSERLDGNSQHPDLLGLSYDEPEITVANNRSNFGFTILCLTDLIEALACTLQLLHSKSKRFEFVNLKRRTRMKVLPLDEKSKGLQLLFQVPGVLQEQQIPGIDVDAIP
ncbi:MAG: hypothetical protein ABIK83_05525 [Candidatus Zixiibacteriota bacterium]